MIVLDTTALSEAFRRRPGPHPESAVARALRRIVEARDPVSIPGIVLQEVLSGVRTEGEYRRLLALLDGFPVLLAARAQHLQAAQVANACRRGGIACTTPDCLIAAQTLACNGELLTADRDFSAMAPYCGLRLYRV